MYAIIKRTIEKIYSSQSIKLLLKIKRKGFTLIELLIVVAIIGILAAVGASVIPNILTNALKSVLQK